MDWFRAVGSSLTYIIDLIFRKDFSDFERTISKICQLLSSAISMTACIIFFLYFIFKIVLIDCRAVNVCKQIGCCKNVSTRKTFFSQHNRFFLYMEMACFLKGFANFVDLIPNICKFAAFLNQAGNFCMFSWAFNISILLFTNVVINPNRWKKSYCNSFCIHCVIELFAYVNFIVINTIFEGIPVLFDLYGKTSGGWCWIDKNKTFFGVKGLWEMLLLYFNLWGIFMFMAAVYFVIGIKVITIFSSARQMDRLSPLDKKNKKPSVLKHSYYFCTDIFVALLGFSSTPKRKQLRRELRIFWRLVMFPFFYILAWVIPSINRIMTLATGRQVWILFVLHGSTAPLNGLFNLFLFFDPLACICLPCRAMCLLICDDKKKKPSREEVAKQNSIAKEFEQAFMASESEDSDNEDNENGEVEVGEIQVSTTDMNDDPTAADASNVNDYSNFEDFAGVGQAMGFNGEGKYSAIPKNDLDTEMDKYDIEEENNSKSPKSPKSPRGSATSSRSASFKGNPIPKSNKSNRNSVSSSLGIDPKSFGNLSTPNYDFSEAEI